MSADHARHPEKDRPASARATHHRHTRAGSLPPAVQDQSQPHRIRERDSTRPNLRRSPQYRRSRFDAQVDSKTRWRLSLVYGTPVSSAMKQRAEIPSMGDRRPNLFSADLVAVREDQTAGPKPRDNFGQAGVGDGEATLTTAEDPRVADHF